MNQSKIFPQGTENDNRGNLMTHQATLIFKCYFPSYISGNCRREFLSIILSTNVKLLLLKSLCPCGEDWFNTKCLLIYINCIVNRGKMPRKFCLKVSVGRVLAKHSQINGFSTPTTHTTSVEVVACIQNSNKSQISKTKNYA